MRNAQSLRVRVATVVKGLVSAKVIKWLRVKAQSRPILNDLYYRYFSTDQQGSLGPVRAIPLPGPGAPHCLVFCKRYWSLHTALEILFAKQRQREGFRVTIISCDRALDTCDHMHYGRARPNCRSCSLLLSAFARRAGVECVSVRNYLKQHSPPLPPPRNYRILSHASWVRLIRSLRPIEPSEFALRDDLERNCLEMDRFLTHFLDNHTVDEILMVNGKFFCERLLREHCHERGIPYLTYERGTIHETIMFGDSTSAVPGDTGKEWGKRRLAPLSEDARTRLYHYMESRAVVGNSDPVPIYTEMETDKSRFLSESGLVAGRRTAVLFTNTIWDSATVGEDTIFSSMFDWIAATVAWFRENKDFQLIIRVHPVEVRVQPGLTTRDRVVDRLFLMGGLPGNVFVIPAESQISPYLLMDLSDCGLVYCSTAGMEMVLRKKPVVVAGKVHYADRDMVYLPETRNEYFELLARPYLEPLARQVEFMERYCYMYYFRHMVPYSHLMKIVPGRGFRFVAPIEEADLLPKRIPPVPLG